VGGGGREQRDGGEGGGGHCEGVRGVVGRWLFVHAEVQGAEGGQAAFELAAQAIPSIATWVDPERAKPHTPAMAGARLRNAYRGQLTERGTVALDGLLFLGDAVPRTRQQGEASPPRCGCSDCSQPSMNTDATSCRSLERRILLAAGVRAAAAVVVVKKKWNELSSRSRLLIIAGGVFEGVPAMLRLRDEDRVRLA
jgi:hypothetical protein